MIWDDQTILVRLLRLFKKDGYSGPTSEAEISNAERALGVCFPLSYRVFLRHFGAAWLTPYEISGLSPYRATDEETPLWSHVIHTTLAIRRVTQGNIPNSYVSISGDGGDYVFYLDTNNFDERGECPVIALGPGVDGPQLASSFLEFAEKVVSGDPLGGIFT